MYQIVFNEISSAELSALGTLEQLQLLDTFKVDQAVLEGIEDSEQFGKFEREGKTLYRFRTDSLRIYFRVAEQTVFVDRILSKNSLNDFFFRSGMPVSEDEALAQSPHFWKLIDEGQESETKR